MNVSTLSRLASAGVVTGVATIAFAAPASAMQPDPPNYGYNQNTGQTVDDGGTNWGLIAGGAAAGVAVVGAGAAAAIGVRRHHHHAPHPVA